jgi:hypothetical protein
MTSESLNAIGTSLGNVASAIAECVRQEGGGAKPPFAHFEECLLDEAARLRGEGQEALAKGLTALAGSYGKDA